MDRKERILSRIDPQGRGLEIGPSFNPVAPKRSGFKVDIVDHCSREGLIEKYRLHGVDLEQIEEVDFVWSGGTYVELTGHPKHYDWVIASHVIEHVPNVVAFLNDCDGVLREGGVLSLAVPDKRYCFDRLRPLTGLAELVDAHLGSRHNHTAGSVVDYFMNVTRMNGNITWNASLAEGKRAGDVAFVHGLADALSGMHAVVLQDAHLDIHASCFTPSSFRLLMGDLFDLGLIALRELSFHGTEGGEFYVTLSRDGRGHGLDRLSLLLAIETEMAACALTPPATWMDRLRMKRGARHVL